jgi:hypothetical protein
VLGSACPMDLETASTEEDCLHLHRAELKRHDLNLGITTENEIQHKSTPIVLFSHAISMPAVDSSVPWHMILNRSSSSLDGVSKGGIPVANI